ncbi:MAG: hypothetical protein V4691_06555 [Pseudomonadota bacterium]
MTSPQPTISAQPLPAKKLKGQPVVMLKEAEKGGYDVQVDPRVGDVTERHTYHFETEAQAHGWIRQNIARFTA